MKKYNNKCDCLFSLFIIIFIDYYYLYNDCFLALDELEVYRMLNILKMMYSNLP